MAASLHPKAVAGRQKKALAMVAVIDRDAVKQGLSPFDQAARIVLKTREWDDATWERIGVRAGYEPKAISDETRELIRSVYRGRAQAPLENRRAS